MTKLAEDVYHYFGFSGSSLVIIADDETFAKFNGTAMMCLASQSLKLHFGYKLTRLG